MLITLPDRSDYRYVVACRCAFNEANGSDMSENADSACEAWRESSSGGEQAGRTEHAHEFAPGHT